MPAEQACLDAALAWERPPGMCIQPQAPKIERLGVMPGAGSFRTLPSKQLPQSISETGQKL